MSLAALLTRALAEAGQQGATGMTEADDSVAGHRILDATVTEAAAQGFRGITIEGVARRAGVNRATVYRRFGDRDSLVAAMTLREGQRMALEIAEAMTGVRGHQEQLIEGFVAAIRIAEEHPIISRTARLEPHDLIAAGLANDGALLALGSTFCASVLRAAKENGATLRVDPDEAGEALARLFAAFVLLPFTHAIDLSTEESSRVFARRTLAPMFLGE